MPDVKELIKIKSVYIFDLFHTLTGLENQWSYLPYTSDYLGIDRKVWNNLLQNNSYNRLTGREKDPFTIIRNLADQVNPSIPDEKIRTAVEIRTDRFAEALIKIPKESIQTLEILREKGIRTGLISNADVMEAARWKESPLSGLFDSTVFSCFAGFAKPDKEIYAISLRELNVKPEDAVFIGDGGSNELRGAKESGITTVLITGVIQELWPEKIPDLRFYADYEILKINELVRISP